MAVTAVSGPASAYRGYSVALSATVANAGSTPTPASTVSFYLSADGVITSADTLIATVATPALAAGQQQVVATTATLAPTLATGSYTLGALVDPANTLVESNEANNARAGGVMAVNAVTVDLAATAVSGPSSALIGNTVSVSTTVRNSGSTAAAASTVYLFLASNPSLSASYVYMGQLNMGALAAGAAQTVSGSFLLPASLLPGSYTWVAQADGPNALIEIGKANNTFVGNKLSASAPNIDLRIKSSSGVKNSVDGTPMTLQATVTNNGLSLSPASTVRWVLSTDATYSADDMVLGTASVPGLFWLGLYTAGINVTLPSSVPAGSYTIISMVDPTNQTAESNNGNNVGPATAMTVSYSTDLVLTSVSAPTGGTTGKDFTFSATLKNQGTVALNRSVNVNFYMSYATLFSTTHTLVGTATVPSVAAGASLPVSLTLPLRSDLLSGTYGVYAVADPGNLVAESNESNNTTNGGSVSVGYGPDLALTAISPPITITRGVPATFTATVVNQGTGGFGLPGDLGMLPGRPVRVSMYLSLNTSITTSDVYLGSVEIASLAAGAALPISLQAVLPAGLAPGQYYIGALLDDLGNLRESNENNNNWYGMNPATPCAGRGAKAPLRQGAIHNGEFLVKFKASVPQARRDAKHAQRGHTKLREIPGNGVHLVRLAAGKPMRDALASYAADRDVEYAEPNYTLHALQNPNEPAFNLLWGMSNTGQTQGTPGADIRATAAWNYSTGSSTVVVMVIDSGVDYAHPDLAANIWVNPLEIAGNGFDDDGNGYVDDVHGINTLTGTGDPMDDYFHGTHVAGTIGAVGNNNLGVVGVNWNVKILPCKALDNTGSGTAASATACLEYARALKAKGVNIVATNNSYGEIGGFSQTLFNAINAQRDILFVAAAGNYGMNNDIDSYNPASYQLPNVISVAATDHNDALASFSNYGRRKVHIGAPGVGIWSTVPFSDYDSKSGTSMATPHVSGLAALLKAQNPTRDWRAIKNLMLAGAIPKPGLSGKSLTGSRLDALNAMTCANRPVFSVIAGPETFNHFTSSTVSVLSINCATPVGPVTGTTSSGQTVTLLDNGVSPDLAAGDGIFTAPFSRTTGSYVESHITFSSAAGSEVYQAPDYAVLSVSGPGSVYRGQNATFNVTVANLSTSQAHAVPLRIYLSTDWLISTADDLNVGEVMTPTLSPGQQPGQGAAAFGVKQHRAFLRGTLQRLLNRLQQAFLPQHQGAGRGLGLAGRRGLGQRLQTRQGLARVQKRGLRLAVRQGSTFDGVADGFAHGTAQGHLKLARDKSRASKP
ncbi:hypothetical protein B566_EDAN019021 [Ephemera danica]|nr:hypothetical protein B566_EDAN019021 [Ephemera danica]